MKYLLALMMAMAASLAPAAHSASRDWTKTVSQAAAGAYVMGNPAAKVRLIEYLSFTCSHCAHFSQEGWPVLKANYVGKGLVSLEVRHAVRDGFDLTGSMLARCTGPRGYFRASEAVLDKLLLWGPRASELAEKSGATLEDKPIGERMQAIAKGTGLDVLVAPYGLPLGRVRSCLSNAAEQKKLAAMANEAWGERKISGTPAFMINGELLPGVTSWQALEPKLQAALQGL